MLGTCVVKRTFSLYVVAHLSRSLLLSTDDDRDGLTISSAPPEEKSPCEYDFDALCQYLVTVEHSWMKLTLYPFIHAS